jgi:hypothetical protein
MRIYPLFAVAGVLFSGAPVLAQRWSPNDNAGTAAADFFGTTNDKPLIFKTDNVEAMRISGNSNIVAHDLIVSGKILTNGLQLPLSAAAGRVLTSDSAGNASWQLGKPGPQGPARPQGETGATGPQGPAGTLTLPFTGSAATFSPLLNLTNNYPGGGTGGDGIDVSVSGEFAIGINVTATNPYVGFGV